MRVLAILCFLSSFFISFSQEIPDYFIENVEVDTTQARKNEVITVSYDLSVDTEGFEVGVSIYLSDDLVLSTGDLLLRTWPSNIGANQNIASIPTDAETGTKNILLVVNKDFTRRESNYSNNVASANTTLTIFEELRSDIKVESWELQESDVVAGDFIISDLTISDTIPSGQPFSVVYLLSEDSVYDTDDFLLLRNDNVFAGNPPGTEYNESFQIPEGTNSGTWQLLAYADVEGVVYEENETNNLAVYEIFVNPLPGTNYTVTSTDVLEGGYERGQRVTVDFVVSETENDINRNTATALYLSLDSVFSTDDRLVAVDPITSIEATETFSFNIPSDLDTGFYQLLLLPITFWKQKKRTNLTTLGCIKFR